MPWQTGVREIGLPIVNEDSFIPLPVFGKPKMGNISRFVASHGRQQGKRSDRPTANPNTKSRGGNANLSDKSCSTQAARA